MNVTPGAISRIYNGDVTGHPVVQVIDVKKITTQAANQDRWRLVISDGAHYQQAMLATQLNDVVRNNQLTKNCLIKMVEFLCNTISNRKIVIILGLEVVSEAITAIGAPTNIEQAAGSGAASGNAPAAINAPAATAAPAQPPVQYQPNSGRTAPAANPAPAQAPNYQPNAGRNFPAQQKPSSFGQAANQNASAFVPIAGLNQYMTKWTIKARVTSRSDLRSWSKNGRSGSLFNVDLLDSEGGEMRGIFFNEAAEKWSQLLQLDKVYTFPKGSLKVADRRFCSPSMQYECSWDAHADIQEVANDDNIQKMKFSFVPISSIQTVPANTTIDIIGVVQSAQPISSIVIKSSGQERKKRNISLVDESRTAIDVTLWGDKAERPDEDFQVGTIMCIKSCRVSDYGGKSLGTVQSSYIDFNPDIAESSKLRAWYDYQGKDQPISSLSGNSGGAGAAGNIQTARKTLGQIKDENIGHDEKPAWFSCKVTLTFIKRDQDRPIWYMACPNNGCNKKVLESNGSWRCEACQKEFSNAEPRYILSVTGGDPTGTAYFNAFNEVGAVILGRSASDLKAFKDANDEPAYDACFEEANFKTYLFKVRAKLDKYQDESRVRLNIHSAEPVDFVTESRYMISEIKKYVEVM